MKKIMITVALCAATAFNAFADKDVFDVSFSCKIPYVTSAGVREYKGSCLKGKLYIEYNEDGDVADTYAVLTESVYKSKENYSVEILDASVCGKKLTCANMMLKFVAEESDLEFTFCGKGDVKQVKKGQPCTACSSGSPACSKATCVSGNLTGYVNCPPNDDCYELGKCGISNVECPFAAMWGNGNIKWNKKESVY